MCLLSGTGLRYNDSATVAGAQTERRGGAGPEGVSPRSFRPVGALLGGYTRPAASVSRRQGPITPTVLSLLMSAVPRL